MFLSPNRVAQQALPGLWTPQLKQGIQVNHAAPGGGDDRAFNFTRPGGSQGTHGIAWGGPTRTAVDATAAQSPFAGMY